MTKQEKIENYMKKLQLSKEEAEQLLRDDEEDFIGESGEEMTKKAKSLKRYEKSEKARNKTTKERKIDENKKFILEKVVSCIQAFSQVIKIKTETEINFDFNDENYTIKLIKHRKKEK